VTVTNSGDPASWIIVMPVKRLDRAKSRLSSRPAGERRSLAHAFALDTLGAALQSPSVRAVVIVTDDLLVRSDADDWGVTWIADEPDSGLSDAVAHGVQYVEHDSPNADIAILTCDLPALRTEELTRALAAADLVPRGFIADASGLGTTLLTARAGIRVDPHFGPRSCAAHVASGAVALDCGPVPGLRRDVDTEVDLWDARRLGVGPETQSAATRDRDETDRG